MSPRVHREIGRCKRHLRRFSRYAKILRKDSKVAKFVPKDEQWNLIRLLLEHRWLYLLKARQIGGTTMIAFFFFWMALFRKNFRVLVVAHRDDSAKIIFEIYQRFYDLLPGFLKIRTTKDTEQEIKFFHGGRIRVTTAGSEGIRGSTWNAVHASEFAFYRDINTAMAAIMQTLAPNAFVVLETTANGMNEAKSVWDAPNGYYKHFVGWTSEPTYVSNKKPNPAPNEPELDYIQKHKLPPKRANWYIETLRTKCVGHQPTFDQEYPIDPITAFLTSGSRFFSKVYDISEEPEHTGLKIFHRPQPYHVYSAGIDTASGNQDGDFSATVILDVTDPKRPVIAATLQGHYKVSDYSEKAYELVKSYNALAVIETNFHGAAVQEYFEQQFYPHLYIRIVYDKVGDQHVDRIGWWTSRSTRSILLTGLNRVLANGALRVTDPRIQWQINHFVFGGTGKAEAAAGEHDDLVLALAMAVEGIEQVAPVRKAVQRVKDEPATLEEKAAYEIATGKRYSRGVRKAQEPQRIGDMSP